MPINCAALPPTLIAAELFGHEKGTFTGAHQRKIGRIEAAHRGTLFLDEIGDMPLTDQIHLLRFLQDKTIERLGSTKTIPIDTRVIVATNTDIEAAVREERFREDLFYRLNVLTLHLPPLRERGEDIELIGRYYLEQFARDHRRRNLRFSRGSLVALMNHPWPGNVRELISTVRRGAVFAEGGVVTPEALGLEESATKDSETLQTLAEAKADLEQELVSKALRKNGNVVQHAARDLGISRVALYRLMKKVGTHSVARPTDSRGSRVACVRPANETSARRSRRLVLGGNDWPRQNAYRREEDGFEAVDLCEGNYGLFDEIGPCDVCVSWHCRGRLPSSRRTRIPGPGSPVSASSPTVQDLESVRAAIAAQEQRLREQATLLEEQRRQLEAMQAPSEPGGENRRRKGAVTGRGGPEPPRLRRRRSKQNRCRRIPGWLPPVKWRRTRSASTSAFFRISAVS